MPISIERLEDLSILRVEGECSVTSATDLKNLLLEGIATGKELQVNLELATAIDLSVLQLLWSANSSSSSVSVRPSDEVVATAREAGFDGFPWLTAQE